MRIIRVLLDIALKVLEHRFLLGRNLCEHGMNEWSDWLKMTRLTYASNGYLRDRSQSRNLSPFFTCHGGKRTIDGFFFFFFCVLSMIEAAVAQASQSAGTSVLSDLFASNPYFSAGFGLIGLGAGLAVARRGLMQSATFLQRQLLVTLEIPSHDHSHAWFLHWMAKQAHTDELVHAQTGLGQPGDDIAADPAALADEGDAAPAAAWSGRS